MKRFFATLFLMAVILNVSAYDALVDGIYYNLNVVDSTAEVTESAMGYYAGDIVIPSSITYQDNVYLVTAIGKKAFYQNSTLTSVTIPESVTAICDFAFAYCEALTTLSLPEGIDSIGNYAFAHSGITHQIICGNMFAYMPESYTGKFTLPDSITKICGAAFTNCSGLTGITLPDGLETIGYSAFGTCSSLGSITIPNSVTYIGEYAFNECASLATVKLPDNLDKIEMCTFYSCLSLNNVVIPATVEKIGRFGFCYCPYLTKMKCYATTPPECGQYAFDQIGNEAELLVPSGCSTAYMSADEWEYFYPRIYEMGGASVDNALSERVNVVGSCGHILIHGAAGESIAVYGADGKMVERVENATEVQKMEITGSGIYFVRFGNGETKRVVVMKK